MKAVDGVRKYQIIIAALFLVACIGYLVAVHFLGIETEVMRDRFWKNAEPLFNGEVPVMEYPPFALVFFAIPRLFADTPWVYNVAYVAEVLVFMVVGLLLVSKLAERMGHDQKRAMLVYAILMLVMIQLVADRYDIFPAILTLASFYMFATKRYGWAGIILAVATMTKLYPAVLFPLYFLYLAYNRQWNDVLRNTLAFVGAGVAIAAVAWLINPELITNFLSYHTDRPLHVFVLSMDLRGEDPAFLPFSQAQQDLLGRVVREKNADSRVFFLDMTERYRAALAHGKNKRNFYTPYAQLRLFLGELEGVPDKLLYLDIDTMCLSDIGQLYDTDIAGFEYGAVLDHMGKFWISPTYCNSGVLLLNLPRLRETKLLQRCRDYIEGHRLVMPDQTALHRLHEARRILPRRFNEQRAPRADTVVKHFCRGIRWVPFFHIYNYKQWEREKVHEKLRLHCFDDIYEEYDRLMARYPEANL